MRIKGSLSDTFAKLPRTFSDASSDSTGSVAICLRGLGSRCCSPALF